MIDDKKLEKLIKILEIATEDYASPKDLLNAVEVMVGLVVKLDSKFANNLNLVSKNIVSEAKRFSDNLEKDVVQAAQGLDSARKETRTLIDALKEEFKGEMDKVTKGKLTLAQVIDEIEMRNHPTETPEITPGQIVDKLESLEGDDRLDKSAIKGLEDWEKRMNGLSRPLLGFAGIRSLVAGRNISINANNSLNPTITNTNPKITVATTAPSDPEVGDLWVDTS